MSAIASALAIVVDAALGVWLGSIVFFSFVAAPTTFDVLGDDAGRVVNRIFPKYYRFGIGLGLLALAAGLATGQQGGYGTAVIVLLAATAVAVVTNLYAAYVLIPKMDAAGDDAFATYHRQSVLLNGVAMLALAAGLVASHL